MKKIKFCLDENKVAVIFIVVVNIFALIVGLFLKQNELQMDAWYIEGVSDGLFGADNWSLATLGANFLMTGFIHLLSLTGLRLMWFHIILLVSLFVSNLIFSFFVLRNVHSKIKYTYCFFALIIVTLRLLTGFFHYSSIASYVIATGCLLLFETIEKKKKVSAYIFPVFWIIWGISIRSDCIYFSVAIMGMLWLTKVLVHCIKKERIFVKAFLWRNLLPFVIVLVIFVALQFAQHAVMQHVEGDYYDWNEQRALLNDFKLPDYDQYEEQYKEIGISRNDYILICTWNDNDFEFFSEEKKEQIIDLSQKIRTEDGEKLGISDYVKKTADNLLGNVEFLLLFLLMLIFPLLFDVRLAIPYLGILFGMLVLVGYFAYLGKGAGSIFHLTDSIIVVSLTATAVPLADSFYKKKIDDAKRQNLIFLISVVALFGMMFISSGKTGDSLWTKYHARLTATDKYYTYLFHEEEAHKSDTYNPVVSEYMEKDKEHFYFRLFVFDWFSQVYPLTDRNFFVTAPEGAADNMGMLGQCYSNISSNNNNLERYGITHPFRDLIKDNVRVEVKMNCISATALILNEYLKEHYYDDVDFSIIKEVDNCVIGRYLRSIDVSLLEKNNIKIQMNKTIYPYFSNGIVILYFELANLELQSEDDILYLQLEDENGEKYLYQATMGNEKTGRITIPATSVQPDMQYTICVIAEHEGEKTVSAEIRESFQY